MIANAANSSDPPEREPQTAISARLKKARRSRIESMSCGGLPLQSRFATAPSPKAPRLLQFHNGVNLAGDCAQQGHAWMCRCQTCQRKNVHKPRFESKLGFRKWPVSDCLWGLEEVIQKVVSRSGLSSSINKIHRDKPYIQNHLWFPFSKGQQLLCTWWKWMYDQMDLWQTANVHLSWALQQRNATGMDSSRTLLTRAQRKDTKSNQISRRPTFKKRRSQSAHIFQKHILSGGNWSKAGFEDVRRRSWPAGT